MIFIPDAGTLHANKHGSLPLTSTLPPEATAAKIVSGLKSSYILSLGQLCDDCCNAIPNKKNRYSINDKEVVIKWEHNQRDDIWEIIIPSHSNDKNSVQTNNYTTVASHASMYSAKPKYKGQHIISMTV